MKEFGYYSILPTIIMLDKELTDFEKILFAAINSLSDKEGFCWAGNAYFSKCFDKTERTISAAISKLDRKNYITILFDKKAGNPRKIYIAGVEKNFHPDRKNFLPQSKKIARGVEKNFHPHIDIPSFNKKKEQSRENKGDFSHIHKLFTAEGIKIICDCEMNPDDVVKLISKIKKSKFLRKSGKVLSWYLQKYMETSMTRLEAALKDCYEDANAPEQSFYKHEYSKEQLDSLFDDIDKLEF